MAQITIADDLMAQIQRTLPESASTDGFVEEAVREKLAVEERRAEFYRLSEETRRPNGREGNQRVGDPRRLRGLSRRADA